MMGGAQGNEGADPCIAAVILNILTCNQATFGMANDMEGGQSRTLADTFQFFCDMRAQCTGAFGIETRK